MIGKQNRRSEFGRGLIETDVIANDVKQSLDWRRACFALLAMTSVIIRPLPEIYDHSSSARIFDHTKNP